MTRNLNNNRILTKPWLSAALLTAALLASPLAAAADPDAQELAEIDQALMLGVDDSTDAASSGCDKQLRAELEQALRREAPEQLAHFEALPQDERIDLLSVYRDSGYVPAVVSAMGAMPGPL